MEVGRWESIGPRKIDNGGLGAIGRLSAIAIDPKAPARIFVGAANSGIWVTGDGGVTWKPVGDSLPTLAVAALAVDPVTPKRIYAALPEYGVFRSDDDGGSWLSLSADLHANVRWGVLLIDPSNTARLYLASEDGVYRSTNGGTAWTLVKGGAQATDLVMVPSSPATLYAGLMSDGIYKTTDGGDTWTKLTSILPTADFSQITLAICLQRSASLYAAFSTTAGLQLYRSNDAGATWTLQFGPATGIYNDVIGVDPANPAFVYITGDDFLRSVDGGVSFTVASGPHADQHGFATDPLTPGVIFTLNDGGIYRSPDRGVTWSFIGAGIANVEFYDIALAATDPDLVIGGTQDNGTIKRLGADPVLWREVRGGDGATVDIDPTNASIMYSMNQYIDSIARSADGGGSWSGIASGLPTGAVCFNAHWQVHPGHPATLVASCTSLWRAVNYGVSWTVAMTPPAGDSIVRTTIEPKGIAYAGTAQGRIYPGKMFTDGSGGSVWYAPFTHPASAAVADLQIDPDDTATLYAAFGGASGRIYRFRRSATPVVQLSARDISANLPAGLIARTIAVDRLVPFSLFVGTQRGVYRGRSTDGGLNWSWSPYMNGMPAADVRDLEVHPTTGVLRAGTYGRSVYEVYSDWPIGSLVAAEGRLSLLRVHDLGTGYGPATDFMDVEVVVWLDTHPGRAFGFQLRADPGEHEQHGMLDILRDAFRRNRRVRIDYVRTGFRNGRIVRVADLL